MSHPSAEPAAVLDDVSHHYAGERLASITGATATLWTGDRVALIGPSGAGKSTLLTLLDGRLSNWSGKAQVLGTVLQPGRRPPRSLRRQVGFVFQEFALVERATVRRNVMNGRLGHLGTWASLLGRHSERDIAAVESAMRDAEILEFADKRVDRLSGGQRQRTAIARCLAQEPRLILADEPISNLDPRRAELVLDLLGRVARQRGASLIFSSHQPALALPHADRVIAMRDGRIVFDGAPSTLDRGRLEALYGHHLPIDRPALRRAC